jgi:hypothetical protein
VAFVRRHCEENLLFWLEAEDFKGIPGKDFLRVKANKIIKKYITEDSKQQVYLFKPFIRSASRVLRRIPRPVLIE